VTDAFDADVLIYAAVPGHPLGEQVAALFRSAVPASMAGIGSVLLLPEVLSRPLRDGATAEVRILAALLARLDLRPVDRATAELATALSSRYRLKAADATHLATAVGTGAVPLASDDQLGVSDGGLGGGCRGEALRFRISPQQLAHYGRLAGTCRAQEQDRAITVGGGREGDEALPQGREVGPRCLQPVVEDVDDTRVEPTGGRSPCRGLPELFRAENLVELIYKTIRLGFIGGTQAAPDATPWLAGGDVKTGRVAEYD
jgi:predicted nucleic acid-binding protein